MFGKVKEEEKKEEEVGEETGLPIRRKPTVGSRETEFTDRWSAGCHRLMIEALQISWHCLTSISTSLLRP